MILFTLPVLVIENISLEDEDFVYLCAYSWYWWIYAVNFMLYVATLSDFRKLFLQILNDIGLIVYVKRLSHYPTHTTTILIYLCIKIRHSLT